MRALIGVMPLYDDEKESLWMLPGYMEMLEKYGAVPIMLPLTANKEILSQIFNICGGFLFTGGHDVSPSIYGAKRSENCGEVCYVRDEMEKYILEKAVYADKSVLGICRGEQFINACFGGTLYQDLLSEYNSETEHHMSPPYDRAAHKNKICPDTLLFNIIGKEEIDVNSYHHQAVKTIGNGLKTAAVSEDGLVEAVFMPDRNFILGIQWHPEFSYKKDENSVKIIKAFIDSVKKV